MVHETENTGTAIAGGQRDSPITAESESPTTSFELLRAAGASPEWDDTSIAHFG